MTDTRRQHVMIETGSDHAHVYELETVLAPEELAVLPDDAEIELSVREHIIKDSQLFCVVRCAVHDGWMLPEGAVCPDPCGDCTLTPSHHATQEDTEHVPESGAEGP